MRRRKNLNKQEKKAAYRWLMSHAKHARRWIRFTIAVSFTSGLLLILQAGLLAHIIDRAYIHNTSRSALLMPLFTLLGVMLLRAVLGWLREVISAKASALVRQKVREDLFQHLLSLSPVQAISLKAGATASSAVEQVEALHGFFAHYIPQMALVVLLPLAILAFVFPFNWIGGLILLITAPLIPIFMALIGMGVESINQRHFKALAKLGAHFLDILQGLTTLKLFMRSHIQLKIIGSVIDEYRMKTMRVLRVAFMSSGVLELFSSIAIAILAVFLGLTLLGQVHYGYTAQHFTLFAALFILLLAPEFFLPLRQLGVHYHARAEAIAAATELLKLFQFKPMEHAGEERLENRKKIRIQLNNVCFSYDKKHDLLNRIDLTVEPGEHVALIGPSGVGKSTLLHLLCGFMTPDQGAIMINQHCLSNLDITHWHQQVACLEQNPRLFSGTIRENILMGNPEAADQEVERAAEMAQVLAFTDLLPDKLNTLVGEKNYGLSGGQAQRVALARVYLSNKPVLLLDEPTASLDQQSEQWVVSALREYVKNKTVISISHRMETVLKADRIFKLIDGRLEEATSKIKYREEEYV